jgi:uncharacterized protein (DUF58 family)
VSRSPSAAPDDATTALAQRLRKVERIELRARKLANDQLPGPHNSLFRGAGLDFEELREYVPGDDVRAIDWNVTARMGRPFVKLHREERQISVYLAVDVSSSLWFGTAETSKRDLASDVAALLAVSAVRSGDRTGLLLFSDRIEAFVHPRKGRQHALRVIREMVFWPPRRARTAIAPAARFLSNVARRRSLVIVLSDLLVADLRSLVALAQRHDVIALTLNDPRELDLPEVGVVALEDAETGSVRYVDTSSRRVRTAYRAAAETRVEERHRALLGLGIEHVDLFTDHPYAQALMAFFRERDRRVAPHG